MIVPNCHLSACSSSFFYAFFLHFHGEPFYGSPDTHFEKITPAPLYLNSHTVEYVREWNDLGCLIAAGKELSFLCRNDLSAFRRSANSIVSSVKKPNEQVLMMLLYTFSVPILTYACDVKQFSCSEMQACQVALNDAIRRIFSFH